MMKINLDPLVELKMTRDCLALEALNFNTITSSLKKALPSLIRGFSSTPQSLELPATPLKKDQKAFFKAIGHIPFTDTMELKAWRPEGVKVTYLEYLTVLREATRNYTTLQAQVVQPYMAFLAQVVSDKNAAVSTVSGAIVYTKLDQERDAMSKRFAMLYANDSYDAQCNVRDVIERNADWEKVFQQINECMTDLQAVKIEPLKLMLKQCVDYLNIIYDLLNQDKIQGATPEVATRLASGAYCVAKELEAFSATYYRALALGGSIDNTTAHIIKAIG